MRKFIGQKLLLATLALACLTTAAIAKPEKREKRKTPHKYQGLVAMGIPHPYEIGVAMNFKKESLLSVQGGYFKRKFRPGKGLKNLEGSLFHLETSYRDFPNPGQLPFWGVSLGYQELTVDGTKEIPITTEAGSVSIDAQAKIRVQSLYWTPHFGLSWRENRTVIYNFVAGIQIPFYVKATFRSKFTDDAFIDESIKSTGAYQTLEGDIEALGEKYGKLALPVIKLFEVGVGF